MKNLILLITLGLSAHGAFFGTLINGDGIPQTNLVQWLDFRHINLLGNNWLAYHLKLTGAFPIIPVAYAPDATQTATRIAEDGTNDGHYYYQTYTAVGASKQLTLSACFLSSNRNVGVAITDGVTGGARVIGGLQSGSIVTAAATFGSAGYTGVSGAITPTGCDTGWYKVSLTVTTGSSTRVDAIFYVISGSSVNYQGDGASYLTFWRPQLIEGASMIAWSAGAILRGVGVEPDLSSSGKDAYIEGGYVVAKAGATLDGSTGKVIGIPAKAAAWTIINSNATTVYGLDSAGGSYVNGVATGGAVEFSLGTAGAYNGTVGVRLQYSRVLSASEHLAIYNAMAAKIMLPNAERSLILEAAHNVIVADHGTFSTDSTDYWVAGQQYQNPYAADTWYCYRGNPNYFTAAQLTNLVDKFIAAKDGSGNLPNSLAADATAAGVFTTGDPSWFIPMLEYSAYEKSGTTTHFSTVAAALKTSLGNRPRNVTTHLVTSAGGTSPWGFHDGVPMGGDNLMGSLAYYEACLRMSAMYTAAGDASNASFFTAEADLIVGNISTLYDGVSGMFLSSQSAPYNQIDVLGSAYVVFLGIATAPQKAGILAYFNANYADVILYGFVRQTIPAGWGNGTVDVYDNAYWSVGNEWVAYTLAQSRGWSVAAQFVKDIVAGGYLYTQREWLSLPNGGTTVNLESPAGSLAFVRAYPFLFVGSTVAIP